MVQTFQPASSAAPRTTRDPITIDSDGQKIIGVIHRPREESTAARPAVAIFHGFLGSKDSPHQIYVKLAEWLAGAGAVALRIDFRGRGDSEGATIDITPAADLADASRALDYLHAQPDVDSGRFGLVGLSWGGTVAALLAGRDHRVTSTVMWSSVPGPLDWRPSFREIDGRRVAEQWGNLVGEQFYAGLRRLDPLEEIKSARGPFLIAYGTEDDAVPPAHLALTRQTLDAVGVACDVVTIKGADHVFMRYEWEKELIERTVSWLRRTLLDVRPA